MSGQGRVNKNALQGNVARLFSAELPKMTGYCDFATGESQTLIERCELFEDEWFVTGEAILPYTPRDDKELSWMASLFLGEVGA